MSRFVSLTGVSFRVSRVHGHTHRQDKSSIKKLIYFMRFRTSIPNCQDLLCYIRSVRDAEYYIAKTNMAYDTFSKTWSLLRVWKVDGRADSLTFLPFQSVFFALIMSFVFPPTLPPPRVPPVFAWSSSSLFACHLTMNVSLTLEKLSHEKFIHMCYTVCPNNVFCINYLYFFRIQFVLSVFFSEFILHLWNVFGARLASRTCNLYKLNAV